MKIARYPVVDTITNKVVYLNCRKEKSIEFINSQSNPENFKLGFAMFKI
jgi:hypothetical protein